jgi:hypothetical protein
LGNGQKDLRAFCELLCHKDTKTQRGFNHGLRGFHGFNSSLVDGGFWMLEKKNGAEKNG